MEIGKVEKSTPTRKRMADDIAAILSGVMAVTSAALALQPGELTNHGGGDRLRFSWGLSR